MLSCRKVGDSLMLLHDKAWFRKSQKPILKTEFRHFYQLLSAFFALSANILLQSSDDCLGNLSAYGQHTTCLILNNSKHQLQRGNPRNSLQSFDSAIGITLALFPDDGLTRLIDAHEQARPLAHEIPCHLVSSATV